MRSLWMAAALLAGATLASPALADPCEGALPSRPGERFSGSVRYVGDGDSLCVGRTGDPSEWIEVRLADFDAPELHSPGGDVAKRALERIALGRQAVCTAVTGRRGGVRTYDRVVAICRIDERSIGVLLRQAGLGGRR